MTAISPLAPARFPDMPPVPGVRLAAAEARLRYRGRPDLLLASFAPKTTVAGTLTRSHTAAPPVHWCRALLGEGDGTARALVVNAGNANAATGEQGHAAVRPDRGCGRRAGGLPAGRGLRQLDRRDRGAVAGGKLTAALTPLHARLADDAWPEAAAAIMTTDTYPKGASARAEIDGVPVVINGIAKGSGMIAPNMGTMLAYVFTDANLPAAAAAASGPARREPLVQRHHGGRRHLDQRHLPALRHRRRAAPADRAGGRPAAPRVPRRAGRRADRPGPADRAGRGGGPEARLDHGTRRGVGGCGAQARARHRQLAAGEDGDRRRGPQLGADRRRGRPGRRALRAGAALDLARG